MGSPDIWTKALQSKKTNGSGFWTRSLPFGNEKYSHLGFMFEVRNIEGKIVFL